MTTNNQKLACIELIKTCAEDVRLKPKSILALYKLATDAYHEHPSGIVFSCLVRAARLIAFRKKLIKYLKGTLENLPLLPEEMLTLVNTGLEQPLVYLYDTITISYYGDGLFEALYDLNYRPRERKPKKVKAPKIELVVEPVSIGVDLDTLFQPPSTKIVRPTSNEIVDFGSLDLPVKASIVHDTPTKWEPQQVEALESIYAWLRTNKRPQIFRLFGYAGTGKTTLAKQVALFVMNEQGKGNVPAGGVLFAAYTGKAASVLRRKGCLNANTLHSLLYKPIMDDLTGRCIGFKINPESPIATAALICIDESSMVNTEMANDVESFGVPILVLGDPAQLEPISGEGYFTNAEPDYTLTDIRRQAKDSPIIYLATRAREGLTIKPGKYGESIVYGYGHHIDSEILSNHDQVLCGLNATRKTTNIKLRKINKRFDLDPIFPVKGDRLICTRNNQDKTLFNGTLWTCTQPILKPIMQPVFKGSTVRKEGSIDVLFFKVRSEDERDAEGNLLIYDTQCSRHHFDLTMSEPAWRDIAGTDQFEFGYGLTVHKFQGSQADSVLLFDESDSFRGAKKKHLYTGITRGAIRLSIQQ